MIKVTIIGSLKQEKEIEMYKKMFMGIGWVVTSPQRKANAENASINILDVVTDYFNAISYSDFVFVINKPDGSVDTESAYEIAFAKRCGTPVLYSKNFASMLEYYFSLKEEE